MSVRRSGGSASGLGARKSTTVSSTEPSNPYEGDVWVNPSAAAAARTTVVAKMKKTAEQTITLDTLTEVVWAATEFTTDAALISLSDDAFIIPSNGYYRFGSMLFWTTAFGAGTSDGYVSIELYVNDAAFTPTVYVVNSHAGWYYTSVSGTAIVELSAGDEITFHVRSNVGLVLRNDSTQMCVAWMEKL